MKKALKNFSFRNFLQLLSLVVIAAPGFLAIVGGIVGDYDPYSLGFFGFWVYLMFLIPGFIALLVYIACLRKNQLKKQIIIFFSVISFSLVAFFVSMWIEGYKYERYMENRFSGLEEVVNQVYKLSPEEVENFEYEDEDVRFFTKQGDTVLFVEGDTMFWDDCVGAYAYSSTGENPGFVEGCGSIISWEHVQGNWYEWFSFNDIYSDNDL